MDIINSKNLLRQVTIMISTIPERKIYLRRILNFYNKFDCKIIVIGSNKEFKSKKKETNLKYIYYKNTNLKNVFKKWEFVKKFVNTKYIINIADDDFALISYLNNSVKILNQNKNYSAVESFVIRFNEKNKKINFNEYFLSHHMNLLKNNNKKKRFNFFHGNLSRSVFRKEIYFKYLNIINKKLDFWPSWADFLFHSLATLDNYRIYYLPELGSLRSENIRTSLMKKYSHKQLKKIDILKNKKNKLFLKKIHSKFFKISLKTSEKEIKKILDDYEINRISNNKNKLDKFLSILTNRLFFFKIDTFFTLKNFFKIPIWRLNKISEVLEIMKYCKKIY